MGKFGRVSRLKPVPTGFYAKTGSSSQTRTRSKTGYSSLVWIRQCYLAKDLLLINYYLHQLKIGFLLRKTEVSFLYKAVA